MQYLSSLRRALHDPFSAQSHLRTHGGFHFISRFLASSACFDNCEVACGCPGCNGTRRGGETVKSLSRNCGHFGINVGLTAKGQSASLLSFRSLVHSSARKESEDLKDLQSEGIPVRGDRIQVGENSGPRGFSADRSGRGGFQMGGSSGSMGFYADRSGRLGFQMGGNSGPSGFPADRSGEDGFQMGGYSGPMGFSADRTGRDGFQMGGNSGPMGFSANRSGFRGYGSEGGRISKPMDFVRGVIDQDGSRSRSHVVCDADFVVIKLLRNNTFVSVTDSMGNTKKGTALSAGNKKLQGGKVTQYSAEATAEYVGRVARELGLKSFVVKVNGFTYFRKKRQAIMSFKEGFTQSRSGENPIVYIEDTTRRAHNGCRLPRKRRI